MKTAKEILQGKMGVAGNVNPVAVLEDETAGVVFERATECMDKAARGGGFLLLPGCDISVRVPESNMIAFVNAAHQWKDSGND